ncbi:DNA-binding transcriptional response regulator, NtrC family, contains REC, AAA-type ATPase, and a Fis-type DNA-binding domains [Marinobacter daqiaonensis]|uniref:DNA-binding transcriptional response regulator, NtrC family, contains REC, AAA-type ATPase, and a Fis-type DNA-binding domains n=1 Tax=Marinobacter daqiaonensis TaxID=650891 RepID=A0A1I6IBL0_9GAMM|nr:sigma-54 dependent transcriptional regulator [Marinobacter daqiaonensis]SFR64132.1 DNA-binding transcriptional response regulator, NtrC family, contains REC, AAA-type ATPase, and a Fis-type DNA-binding domains [Marinobacter daqiaonensis]
MRSQILIVDDEKSFVRSMTFALGEAGFGARSAHTGEDALNALAMTPADLMLLDLRLPGMSGMDVLAETTRLYPDLPVVMISAHGDTRSAVQAVKAGATDYLTKPFALDELLHLIRSITDRTRMRDELDYHRKRTANSSGLVGSSQPMKALWQTVQRVAASSTGRILLLGESGTGKAVVARAIHQQSPRAEGAFVEINCAALPEQLIEAELFGAEKGAYTGAHQKRSGLVALAHGGTLFLDEIGELPPSLQAKFLHFLENGDYRPVGGTVSHTADVRVVAATNRALEEDVRSGRFREDLFFRLNVIELTVPPLRERGEDLQELLDVFIESQAREEGCRPIAIPPETLERLCAYRWPGNVRELRNLVERLTILHPGQPIRPDQLPAEFTATATAETPVDAAISLDQQLQHTERGMILQALEQSGGHKGRAAEKLGMSRHAFKRRLQRLGLT